jgi:hypothetical protein
MGQNMPQWQTKPGSPTFFLCPAPAHLFDAAFTPNALGLEEVEAEISSGVAGAMTSMTFSSTAGAAWASFTRKSL